MDGGQQFSVADGLLLQCADCSVGGAVYGCVVGQQQHLGRQASKAGGDGKQKEQQDKYTSCSARVRTWRSVARVLDLRQNRTGDSVFVIVISHAAVVLA